MYGAILLDRRRRRRRRRRSSMGVRKVLESISDLWVTQGHWSRCRSIGHIRFPISLPLQLCLNTVDFPRYCQSFPDICRGHVTLNTSFEEEFVVYAVVLLLINLYTKSEVPNFTHSRDMRGTPKFKNWSRDPDHALFRGAVCHG